MKRKLTSCMLLLAFVIGSISMFNSCKDNDDDLRSDYISRDAATSAAIKTTTDALEGRIKELENWKLVLEQFKDSIQNDTTNAVQDGRLAKLETSLSSLNAVIDTLKTSLNGDISDLTDSINNLNASMSEAQALIQVALNNHLEDSTLIKGLRKEVDALNSMKFAWSDSLKAAYDTASMAYAQSVYNYNYIHNLDSLLNARIDSLGNATNDSIANLKASISAVLDSIESVKNSVEEVRDLANENLDKAKAYADSVASNLKAELLDTINTKLSDIETAYKLADEALQDQLDTLKSNMASLKTLAEANQTAIGNLQTAMSVLEGKYNSLYNALASLVTGVIVQSVENPIYGTFALPVGISSNVLLGYYGKSAVSYDRQFPSSKTSAEYQGATTPAGYMFSEADLNFLNTYCSGYTAETVKSNDILLDESEGNAGKVYMTVNPSSVDFTKLEMSLVNSQDVASPVKLSPLKKSDKTLTFGYTKAADNGFYEANASLSKETVESATIAIEPQLKSSMATVLKNVANLQKGKVSDYTTLASTIYKQFNGILDAEGLKASWTDSLGNHSVYSNYCIAATAFKPLSYKFLYGSDFSKLPTITPLDEDMFDISTNDIHFDFDFNLEIDHESVSINLDSIHFTGDTIMVTLNVPSSASIDTIFTSLPDSSQYELKVNLVTKDTTIYIYDLIDFVANLNDDLNGMIDGWEDNIEVSLNSQINDLIAKIQDAVDSMSDNLKVQLNDQVNNLVDSIEDQVLGKLSGTIGTLNNYIGKVNSYINRVNKVLSDPNHFLQVAMFYQGNDGAYHQLSNSRSVPSVFTAGSGNAIGLVATSYTAELVAPAYKKFVAVTNVYKNSDNSKSAQGGDAGCIAAAQQANNAGFFNEVILGKQKLVAFEPVAGYTYEITYSGLDYSGYSSTRKFYVRVK